MIKKKIIVLLLLSVSSQLAMGQECLTPEQYSDTWRNSRYTVNNDGTVTDTETGLMWKQCREGLSGNACTTGETKTFTWQESLAIDYTKKFANHTDWRLPNIKELKSLVASNCYGPSINETIFPVTGTTRVSGYWSSSPDADNSSNALLVYFSQGYTYSNKRDGSHYVRLVR